MQLPVKLLKEGTDTSQGIPQIVSNINACQVIGEAIKEYGRNIVLVISLNVSEKNSYFFVSICFITIFFQNYFLFHL